MQLGMIGLGRMGANMVRRLMRDGHECVVTDRDGEAVDALVAERDRWKGLQLADQQRRQELERHQTELQARFGERRRERDAAEARLLGSVAA